MHPRNIPMTMDSVMKCGGYQPADYNESTGNYEIGNGDDVLVCCL